jgi:hypothetical protein
VPSTGAPCTFHWAPTWVSLECVSGFLQWQVIVSLSGE